MEHIMETQTTNTFIELHVPDFQRVLDFYGMLGFEAKLIDPEYLTMSKGQSVLNFYKGTDEVYKHPYFNQYSKDTKRGYAVEIILFEKDIKNFYNQIQDKIKIVAPLTLKHWGRYDFRIEDPFGFYIRITEPYNWIDKQQQK